jgi:hypothetical protein
MVLLNGEFYQIHGNVGWTEFTRAKDLPPNFFPYRGSAFRKTSTFAWLYSHVEEQAVGAASASSFDIVGSVGTSIRC